MHPSKLAQLLRQLRKRHQLSSNQLARLLGISRRTLARIESGHYSSTAPILRSPKGVGGRTLSPRTAFRLARALLPPDQLQRHLAQLTRPHATDPDPLLRLLDSLSHFPAFLFHRSAAETLSGVEGPDTFRQYAHDYRHSLHLLLRFNFGARNLGARLRAFRLRHDLTLAETAGLLGLSTSQLHRLERGERQPSPRTRYRILRLLTLPIGNPLSSVASRSEPPAERRSRAQPRDARLLTLPVPVGRGFNPAAITTVPALGEKAAAPLGRRRLGRVGTATRAARLARPEPACRRQASRGKRSRRVEGSAFPSGQGFSPAESKVSPFMGRRPAGSRRPRRIGRVGSAGQSFRAGSKSSALKKGGQRPWPRAGTATRAAWLAAAKTALAQPPPDPSTLRPSGSDTLLDRLRRLWLASPAQGGSGGLSTRELASLLGISQPHLIRLLRGDRRPSRALRERLELLLSPR